MAKKIIIVEDEDTLCESLKRVFIRNVYDVDISDSAETAIELLETKAYDVIITDIVLPGISGIDLLKKYKKQKPEQIVIIMTAYANLETAIEALRAGAYDYLTKPFTHEEILGVVKNAVSGVPPRG